MNEQKFKIEQRSEIALLSEVLPYEMPLIFSNHGFFDFLVSPDRLKPAFIKSILRERNNYVPYRYEIKRSETRYRTLSLIHPLVQLEICAFYEKFGSLLIKYCARSKFSLRKPTRQTKFIYAPSTYSNQPVTPARYFIYSPFSFLHKFFSSFEYTRLEKQFHFQLQLDISKFFDSIYTHSISWAVKDKTYSKANISRYSLENEFDRIMMLANYNETNGIVIGPEVSRIFAEIILQKIDVNVEQKIKKLQRTYGTDYVVRRYIDDYFIFSSDQELLDRISQLFEEEMEFYKLHLNDSKTQITRAPFITNISKAKIKLSHIFNRFYSEFFRQEVSEDFSTRYKANKIKNISRAASMSIGIIDEMKTTLDETDVRISDISGYALGIVHRKLAETLRISSDSVTLSGVQATNVGLYINVILDVVFYLSTLDTVTKNTTRIVEIILIIQDFCREFKIVDLKVIEKRIHDELLDLFSSFTHKKKSSSVEASNLLVALSVLHDDFLLSPSKLAAMFDIPCLAEGEAAIEYFNIMSILYYVKRKAQYGEIKDRIISFAISRFRETSSPMMYSELFCMFFDFIKCPYIERAEKYILIDHVVQDEGLKPLNTSKKNEVINYIDKFGWFTDWRSSVRRLVNRKVLKMDY